MPEIGPIIEPPPQPIKPPIPKPVISNPIPTPVAETDQVQSVINTLRKPEIRTPFSEVLRSGVQQYFGEVLNQENPPELIQKLNEQKGTILLTGSTLRGTARTESSDLDVLILHDGEGKAPLERSGEHLLDRIVSSPDYHPDKISFPTWLARHLKK